MTIDTNSVISWKTHAWADPQMVAWYAGQMTNFSGTNALKLAIERNFIDCYATGEKLLDVGIGTGRASLPLARRGFKVTGVDASQSMLDETRRQAQATPIDLRIGDVTRLPVEDGDYDCIVSLNVMVHFPHWQSVLAEWKRAIRPGGRIIFDIHSFDHLAAIFPPAEARRHAEAGLEAGGHSGYIFHLDSKELIEWADENGFRVSAIAPVGGIWSKGNVNVYKLAGLEQRYDWQRLLSWLETDENLLRFAIFLEETIVHRLPPQATRRYFAVLDYESDPKANASLRNRIEAQYKTLIGGPMESIASWLPIVDPEWQARLASHLVHIRNRHLFYRLLQALRSFLPWLDTGIATEPYAALFSNWEEQDGIDQITGRLVKNWDLCNAAPAEKLSCSGIPLAPTLQYSLTEAILTRLFGVFSGNRS